MMLPAQALIYAAAGAGCLALALHALFTRAQLLAKIVASNVAATGVFLVLLAIAPRAADGVRADPVPQAMVLTGIVISVSITAYALSLLRRLYDETGARALPEDEP